MKKDKKAIKVKPRKLRPSYYEELFKEYLIEFKYNKLYYGTMFAIAIFVILSLYFQYTFERAQRSNLKQESGVIILPT